LADVVDQHQSSLALALSEKAVGHARGVAMKSGLRVFVVFAAVFAVAFVLKRALVPHVVPVSFAEEPQPLWAVETAFVLRALELMSGSIALIALLLVFGVLADRLRQMHVKPETVRLCGSRRRP
jgi:hypothetical protein